MDIYPPPITGPTISDVTWKTTTTFYPIKQRRVRRFIVESLDRWCERLHFIFHHRPWLWLPLRICPLANVSAWLDQRWGTGVWTKPRE